MSTATDLLAGSALLAQLAGIAPDLELVGVSLYPARYAPLELHVHVEDGRMAGVLAQRLGLPEPTAAADGTQVATKGAWLGVQVRVGAVLSAGEREAQPGGAS